MLKSFAGGRLYGRTWGIGARTVLALHGWRRDHRDFEPVFGHPQFAEAHGAVGVDLPGFGATPEPPEAWGTHEYAAAVLDVLEELDGPVVVLGHSFGGRVALRLAATAPERVARLVLTGVPLLARAGAPRRPAVPFRLARRLHRLGLVGDERMEAMRNRYGSPDYRAAQGVMRQIFVRVIAERYDEDLAALACPVDLVWGADDTEVPLEVARRGVARLQQGTLQVVEGAGHLLPTEAPAALREAVLAAAAATRG